MKYRYRRLDKYRYEPPKRKHGRPMYAARRGWCPRCGSWYFKGADVWDYAGAA